MDDVVRAQEAMGINEDTEQDPKPDEKKEETPEPQPKPKAEPKPKSEPEDGEDDDEEEDEDEGEEEGEDGKPSKARRPVKEEDKEKPSAKERSIFKQLGEVQSAIKSLTDAVSAIQKQSGDDDKKSPKANLNELKKKLSEKHGMDEESVSDLLNLAVEEVKEYLDSSGVLRKDLPEDVKKKLDVVDKLSKKDEDNEQVQSFEREWTDNLPQLKQHFPNAKAEDLEEAKKIVDQVAHSKKFHIYPLDYVIWKNLDKLKPILTRPATNKGVEGSGKARAGEGKEEIPAGISPDSSPDDMKKYERASQSLLQEDSGRFLGN